MGLEPPLVVAELRGFSRSGRFLEYVVPGDRWVTLIPVSAEGVLEQLRDVSQQLSRTYLWREGTATAFVLTGLPPLIPIVRYTLKHSSRRPLARITLVLDPALTPEEVRDRYRKIRGEVVGKRRYRPLSVKATRLAEFAADFADESSWAERMGGWNAHLGLLPLVLLVTALGVAHSSGIPGVDASEMECALSNETRQCDPWNHKVYVPFVAGRSQAAPLTAPRPTITPVPGGYLAPTEAMSGCTVSVSRREADGSQGVIESRFDEDLRLRWQSEAVDGVHHGTREFLYDSRGLHRSNWYAGPGAHLAAVLTWQRRGDGAVVVYVFDRTMSGGARDVVTSTLADSGAVVTALYDNGGDGVIDEEHHYSYRGDEQLHTVEIFREREVEPAYIERYLWVGPLLHTVFQIQCADRMIDVERRRYDDDGYPTETRYYNGLTDEGDRWYEYRHDAGRLVSTEYYVRGHLDYREQWSYDAMGRPVRMSFVGAATSFDTEYTYECR